MKIELRLAGLTSLARKALTAFRFIASSAPPAVGQGMKLAEKALDILEQVGTVSAQARIDATRGLTVQFHGKGLKGKLAQWVSGMCRADFGLLSRLPQGGFWASAQRTSVAERNMAVDLINKAWPALELVLKRGLSPRALKAVESLKDNLKRITQAAGDREATVAFFDPKDASFHFASINDISNVASFRKAYQSIGRFLTRDYPVLRKSFGALTSMMGMGRRGGGLKAAKKKRTAFRFKKTRLGRYRVDLLQIILPKKKKGKMGNVGPVELILGKRFEIATAYVGKQAYTCAGKHWKRYLKKIIAAKTASPLSGLGAALKRKAGPKTASIGGFSLATFVKGLLQMAVTYLPKMAAAMLKGKRSPNATKVAAKLKQASKLMGMMVQKWPAGGGGIYYRSDAMGPDYRFQMQLDSREILALARVLMMTQSIKGRGPRKPKSAIR